MKELGILTPVLAFQILNVLLVLFLLNRLLYQPILNMFDQRRIRIRDGLAEADRVREEAAAERARLEAQINEERRTSQEKLREAVARSEEAAKRRLAEADAEADAQISRAKADAEQLRKQALAGLQSEIADLAVRAATKVIGAEVDAQKHRQLIDRFLREQLGEIA